MTTGKVTLLDYMGDDLSVVNAARVSFSKTSEALTPKDEGLLRFLAKHDHWTPFGHTSLSFRIKAPIFVARQLGKHQVGLVWNEESRRYISDDPTFHKVDYWRESAENVKQGSSLSPVPVPKELLKEAKRHSKKCLKLYKKLLKKGVCPEQARMVLPQATEVEWIWTGNLYAFASLVEKRTSPDTQVETREVALEIGRLLFEAYPASYKALLESKET